MQLSQQIIDDIIRGHGSIEAYLAHAEEMERRNAFDWQGIDSEDIKHRYSNVPASGYRSIRPCWDLRRSALSIGEMANQIDSNAIPLYLATRKAFLDYSLYGEAPLGLIRGTDAKFYRVLGNWERSSALTPPLMFMWGDKLSKWDGHHRIMIALMSEAPVIPFYSSDGLCFPGIQRASPEMHSEAAWCSVT